MKYRAITFNLVIASIIVTIVSLKIQLPLFAKYSNTLLLLILGGYYMYMIILDLLKKEKSAGFYMILTSYLLLMFTCSLMAIFQSVQSGYILSLVNLVTIVNGIFSIYLFLSRQDKALAISHFVLAAVLIGVGAFVP